MKLTKSRLRKIIKEELQEISRTPQTKYGEPSGSGSRQAFGTVKDAILDKFQELYELWSEVEAVQEDHPRAYKYWQELGALIQEIEDEKKYDDKRYFSEGYSDPRKDGYFHALDGKEPQRNDAKYMVGYKMGKEERKSRGKG